MQVECAGSGSCVSTHSVCLLKGRFWQLPSSHIILLGRICTNISGDTDRRVNYQRNSSDCFVTCYYVCLSVDRPQPCKIQSQNFTCVAEIFFKNGPFSGEVCAGGYRGDTTPVIYKHNIIFSVLTHSIPKNVDYGTHEKGSHPVQSNGSVTVPVQTTKHCRCHSQMDTLSKETDRQTDR